MYKIIGKYTSALVTNDNIEQEAVQQIHSIVNCKAYEGCKIVIQPDSHCGKGSVIGFCSTFGKYIDPRTVGVDIENIFDNKETALNMYKGMIGIERVKVHNEIERLKKYDEQLFEKLLSI